jgi:hypothetical protein
MKFASGICYHQRIGHSLGETGVIAGAYFLARGKDKNSPGVILTGSKIKILNYTVYTTEYTIYT